MSSEIVLRVFNFLVHYGEENNSNFRHLLEDGFFHLVDEEAIINSKRMSMYLDKTQYIKEKSNFYFTGIFYKEAKVNIEHQKDKNKKAINSPVKADGYPRAFFILDLARHRLYWFTKKNETFAPYAPSFASFIKKKVYPTLKASAEESISLEYKSDKKLQKDEQYSDYRRRRMLEMNMTRKLFTISAVPVIDQQQIEQTILDQAYVIKGIVVKGYLPNSTEKDGKDIRTIGDPLETLTKSAKKELGATVKTEFKGINSKIIEKKEGVLKLVNELSKKDNFDLAVSLVNVSDPSKKIVIHSNPDEGNYSDMGVKKIFEGNLTHFDDLKKEIDSVEKKDLTRSKISDQEIKEAQEIINDAIETKKVKFVER